MNAKPPVNMKNQRIRTIERIGEELLLAIGEDPEREGLQETPARFARFWDEFIHHDPGNTGTTFEQITADQVVVVSGVRVYSLCEHHLIPFWVDLTMGYIATERVLGLSKFARIAHQFAHRLQVQERLVHQIADEIATITGSPSVAVHGEGVHLCMIMRGVKTEGTMKTNVLNGEFRSNPELRREFMSLV